MFLLFYVVFLLCLEKAQVFLICESCIALVKEMFYQILNSIITVWCYSALKFTPGPDQSESRKPAKPGKSLSYYFNAI